MDWITRIVLGAAIAAIAVSLPAVGDARPGFRQPADRIAFTSLTANSVATASPDGSQLLTFPGFQYHLYQSWSPAWSPDGAKIAHVTNYPTGWMLVVRNSDGSG